MTRCPAFMVWLSIIGLSGRNLGHSFMVMSFRHICIGLSRQWSRFLKYKAWWIIRTYTFPSLGLSYATAAVTTGTSLTASSCSKKLVTLTFLCPWLSILDPAPTQQVSAWLSNSMATISFPSLFTMGI